MKTRVNPQKLQRNPVVQQIIRNPSRAIRRHEDKRHKERAKRKLDEWNMINASWSPEKLNRLVGSCATQHNTCGCWMCTTDDDHMARRKAKDEARFFEWDVL